MLLNHVALCPANVWKELVLAWSRKLTLIIFLSPCWGKEISHYKRGIVHSRRSWTCYPCGHLILLVQPSFSTLLGFFTNSQALQNGVPGTTLTSGRDALFPVNCFSLTGDSVCTRYIYVWSFMNLSLMRFFLTGPSAW